MSTRLLHEASGLPYVRERLITVGQNHLARMHASPVVEHTINSGRTNIVWDKYKTPISILKTPDWSTDNDYKMQRNQVASLNVQPLTLKVVVRPVHGHVWHSPWTLNQSQHGYLVVVFLDATSILKWLDHREAISFFYITTDNNCLFAVAIAYISKCLQINKPISPKLVANYFPRRLRPLICAGNPYTFRPCHEKEAKV